jgi:hypothetical protein
VTTGDRPDQQVEGPWKGGQVEGIDQEPRVLDLPAAGRAEEAAQPSVVRVGPVRRLAPEDVERREVPATLDDVQHPVRPECADELFLEVVDTCEEAERLQRHAVGRVPETGTTQPAPDEALLGGVVEPDQPGAEPARPEPLRVVAEVGRTPGRGDRDPLADQVDVEPRGEGEYGDLVADALDEHDGALHAATIMG